MLTGCRVAVVFALACLPAFVARAAPTLQYHFNPGEELVYEISDSEDLVEDPAEATRRYEMQAEWRVLPTRRNDDGSWRLIVSTHIRSLLHEREAGEGHALGEWKPEPHVRFENTFLAYCDFRPDGVYEMNPTLGYSYLFHFAPEVILPPLPQGDSGGEPSPRTAPASETTYRLKIGSAAEGLAQLTGQLQRPTSKASRVSHKLELRFDTQAGRVVAITETTESEDDADPFHSRTSYELTAVNEHSTEWLESFKTAALSYFDVREAWWQEMHQAIKARSKAECELLVSNARDRLVEAQQSATNPQVRAAYEGLLALHDRDAEGEIESAAQREGLYSKPPVAWVTTNLAGEPRRRADYEGKVVLLDFWYRGCGHCILAFPKVKAIHEKYKDLGVVVLGVNNDSDVEDANHVVDAYSIPYESVRNTMAEPIDEKANPKGEADVSEVPSDVKKMISYHYNVRPWPTFIVLDQRGRVAEVVEGNAEDLVEHVSKVIDGLLDSEADQGDDSQESTGE